MLLLALACGVAGASLAYLASPKQNWGVPARARVLRWPGLVLSLVSLLPWCRVTGLAAGIAAALTTLMLAWVLAPYLGWWLRQPSRARAARQGGQR